MTIRLVTFDLDDTLWQTAPVIAAAEDRLRRWLAEHAPALGDFTPERLVLARQQALVAHPELRQRISSLRLRMLERELMAAGYQSTEANKLAEAGFRTFLDARHEIPLTKVLHSTLATLAERYTLGVLTNGNADVYRLGLGEYFHFALGAEELGVGKPDPLPFLVALERCGMSPLDALHIGDHPKDDIKGACQAGWQSIWFNPSKQPWTETGHWPTAQVHTLQDIPPLLEGWS